MSIKINNFVDVNIVRSTKSLSEFVYNTAVYIAGESDVNNFGYYANIPSILAGSADGTKAKPRSKDILGKTVETTFTLDAFGKVFFDNGGQYLHVIQNVKFDTIENCWQYTEDGTTFVDLPLTEIVFFKASSTTATGWPSAATDIKEGIDQKLFLNAETINFTDLPLSASGIIYKYIPSGATETAETNIAALAAYLTKINLNDAETIKDYAFTAEIVNDEDVINTNSIVTECITNNINVDSYLSGAVRNIGGNDSTGEDIMNLILRIILQQTVSQKVLNLLISKIPLTTVGLAQIQSAVADELTRYVSNGYISTEKFWTADDLYIDGELIIAKNNPLASGYKIHIDSISAKNQEDHSAPDIYIIYGDQVGIRFIKISGEVF